MSVTTPAKLRFNIRVQQDSDAPYPFEDDDVWKLVTLRMGLISDVPPDWTPADEGIPSEQVSSRVFPVSCYRHGGSYWFLADEPKPGLDHWDTRRVAGFLILTDPEAIPEFRRRRDAAATLEVYNQWGEGDCWGYQTQLEVELPPAPNATLHACPDCKCGPALPRREFEDYDSCWGFIGEASVLEELFGLVKALHSADKLDPARHVVCFSAPDGIFSRGVNFAEQIRELGFECELDPDEF
jgi:hypothetical protein